MRLAFLVGSMLLCTGVVGCATAQPTDRQGLLEGGSSPRSASLRRGIFSSQPGARLAQPAVEVESSSATGMAWPLRLVEVTSPFGKRGRDFHEGIDLKAPHGTAVLAAQDGTVLYAGSRIRGYGKMIVLRHQRQVSTVYAHNSQLLVRAGQNVKRGQQIALSGKTGHVTGPHLHFEVRDGMAALNPMDYLPGRRLAVATESGPSKPAAPSVALAPVRGAKLISARLPTAPARLPNTHQARPQKVASAAHVRRRAAAATVVEADR